FPLTYASIAFASMLAFLAARYLLRDKIRSLLIRRPKYRKVDRGSSRRWLASGGSYAPQPDRALQPAELCAGRDGYPVSAISYTDLRKFLDTSVCCLRPR